MKFLISLCMLLSLVSNLKAHREPDFDAVFNSEAYYELMNSDDQYEKRLLSITFSDKESNESQDVFNLLVEAKLIPYERRECVFKAVRDLSTDTVEINRVGNCKRYYYRYP